MVSVPGAQPLLGGRGVDPHSGAKTTPRGVAPSPTAGAGNRPPRTDTVLDGAANWLDAGAVLPRAALVGIVILALGLLAIHLYERGYREPSKASTARSSPPRR
jgi:hypothetical protein